MLTVKFSNSGGVLDSKDAPTHTEAARRAVEMIQSAGELYPGDRIEITGDEEEAPTT